MEDNHLDEFAAEQEPAAESPPRPGAAAGREAVVKIVLTDEQIASSWEMFPSEATPDVRQDDPMDAPLLLDDDENRRFVEISSIDSPVPGVARGPRAGRRSPIRMTILVVLAMMFVGGWAMVQQFGSPVRVVETSPSPSLPPPPSPPSPSTPLAPVGAPPESTRTAAAAVDEPPAAAIAPPIRDVLPHRLGRVETARTARRLAPSTIAPRTVTRNVAPPAARAAASSAPPTTRPTASALDRQPHVSAAPVARVAASVAASGVAPAAGAVAPVATMPAAAAPMAAAPVAAPPAATVPPATAVAPSSPPLAAASTPTADERAVLATLHRYQVAFTNLDSSAAHKVWPSVDVRALGRAFDQLDQQTVDLQGCNVGVAGDRAEAACTGTASYVRKVGNKAMRTEERRWHFTLQQSGGAWLIDRVEAR